jgi:hypothetical protein
LLLCTDVALVRECWLDNNVKVVHVRTLRADDMLVHLHPYRRVWLRAHDLYLLLEVVSAEDETHVPELLKLLLDFGRLGLVTVRAS